MKNKAAAWAFFLTFLLTTILGIAQIKSSEKQSPSPAQQAMQNTNQINTQTVVSPQTLP